MFFAAAQLWVAAPGLTRQPLRFTIHNRNTGVLIKRPDRVSDGSSGMAVRESEASFLA
jgi:hypothetical protein